MSFLDRFLAPKPEVEDPVKEAADKSYWEDIALMGPEGDHAALSLTNHMPRSNETEEAARQSEIARLMARQKELRAKRATNDVTFHAAMEADHAKLPSEERVEEKVEETV